MTCVNQHGFPRSGSVSAPPSHRPHRRQVWAAEGLLAVSAGIMLEGGMLHIIPSEDLGLRKLCRRERCRWSRGVCRWRMQSVSPHRTVSVMWASGFGARHG